MTSVRKEIVVAQETPTTSRGSTLHMIDQSRFAKVRRAFKPRGLGGLSLVAMMRIVIEEWLRAESVKPKD